MSRTTQRQVDAKGVTAMKRYLGRLGVGAIAAAGIAVAAPVSVHAASATANALASIVDPIAIAQTADLDFASIVAAAGADTVIVSPAGVRTCGGTLSCFGTVAAASFDVTGGANLTYSITLPAAALVISDGGPNNMNVDTWTSSPTPTGTLSGAGTETLTVGATLNVGASQVSATYGQPAETFTVTVDYN